MFLSERTTLVCLKVLLCGSLCAGSYLNKYCIWLSRLTVSAITGLKAVIMSARDVSPCT